MVVIVLPLCLKLIILQQKIVNLVLQLKLVLKELILITGMIKSSILTLVLIQ